MKVLFLNIFFDLVGIMDRIKIELGFDVAVKRINV